MKVKLNQGVIVETKKVSDTLYDKAIQIGLSKLYDNGEIYHAVIGPVLNIRQLQDVFNLDEGIGVIDYPSSISEASYDDLQKAIDLFLSRLKGCIDHNNATAKMHGCHALDKGQGPC